MDPGTLFDSIHLAYIVMIPFFGVKCHILSTQDMAIILLREKTKCLLPISDDSIKNLKHGVPFNWIQKRNKPLGHAQHAIAVKPLNP